MSPSTKNSKSGPLYTIKNKPNSVFFRTVRVCSADSQTGFAWKMHGKKKKKHEVERRKRDKKIFHFWYNILVAAFSIDWLKWFLVLETKFDTEMLLLSVFKLSKYFMTHKFLKYYQILKFDFKKFGESQCNKTIQAWLQHLCERVRDRVSSRHWWLRCRLVTCHCN